MVMVSARIAPAVPELHQPELDESGFKNPRTKFLNNNLSFATGYLLVFIAGNHSVVSHLLNTVSDLLPSLMDLITNVSTLDQSTLQNNPSWHNFAINSITLLGIMTKLADSDHRAIRKQLLNVMHMKTRLFPEGKDENATWKDFARMLVPGAVKFIKSEQRGMLPQTCGSFACQVGAEVRYWSDQSTKSRSDIPAPPPLLQSCARCKRIRYSSKECQKADWKVHNHFCGVDRMPRPEDLGLGADWTSESCRLGGNVSSGLDFEAFEARMQGILDSLSGRAQ